MAATTDARQRQVRRPGTGSIPLSDDVEGWVEADDLLPGDRELVLRLITPTGAVERVVPLTLEPGGDLNLGRLR